MIMYCPDAIRRTVEVGDTSEAVSWIEPYATDNSGMAPMVTMTHEPGDYFTVGVTQVHYTFTDQAGNSATCAFNVHIGNQTFFN